MSLEPYQLQSPSYQSDRRVEHYSQPSFGALDHEINEDEIKCMKSINISSRYLWQYCKDIEVFDAETKHPNLKKKPNLKKSF
jgi:hypothetical protein